MYGKTVVEENITDTKISGGMSESYIVQHVRGRGRGVRLYVNLGALKLLLSVLMPFYVPPS